MTGISFVLRASFVSRLFILTGVFAGSASVAQGQINFRKPDFDTGKRPLSVDTADFNRDGLPDIVTANGQDNSVSLLLNDGHGGFSPHTDYPVGGNPAAVLAADFNNDGVPDIAVANQNTNSISILLGNGNGSVRALPAFSTGAGPEALAAGDFNHDGKLDLAVLNQKRWDCEHLSRPWRRHFHTQHGLPCRAHVSGRIRRRRGRSGFQPRRDTRSGRGHRHIQPGLSLSWKT